MERYQRHLNHLFEKLLPLLRREAETLGSRYPGLGVEAWGHEAGRQNELQAYSAGISSDAGYLAIDILGLHLFPRAHLRLISPSGDVVESYLQGTPIHHLKILPMAVRDFAALLDAYIPVASSRPELTLPDQALSPILSAALSHVQDCLGLSHPLPLVARTRSALERTTEWCREAEVVWKEELVGLTRGMLETVFGGHPCQPLPCVPEYPMFTPSPAGAPLFLKELYGAYPDASAAAVVSPVAQEGDRALLLVALTFDPDARSRKSQSFSWRRTGVEPGPSGGPPIFLLVLGKKGSEWVVTGNRDMRLPEPNEIRRRMIHSLATGWISELREELDVDTLGVESTHHREGLGTILDFSMTRAGMTQKVSVASNLFHHGAAKVFPYPIALVGDLSFENVREGLRELLSR